MVMVERLILELFRGCRLYLRSLYSLMLEQHVYSAKCGNNMPAPALT